MHITMVYEKRNFQEEISKLEIGIVYVVELLDDNNNNNEEKNIYLCYEINNIGKYSNTCPIKSYVPNFTLHLLIRMFGITKMGY